MSTYSEIATKLKDTEKNIIFTKIDMGLNEVENLTIKKFPLINFYKMNDK